MFNDSYKGQTQYCEECQKWAEKCEKLEEKLEKIKKHLRTCSIGCKKCSIQKFCQTYKIREIIEGVKDERRNRH